ncbi:acyl-CoA dehydratase activase [bacterium]
MKNISLEKNQLYLGIDLGSRFIKIVYGNNLSDYSFLKYPTIFFYKNFCQKVKNSIGQSFQINLEKINSKLKNTKKIVSTGYGRNIANFQDAKTISEIHAHIQGALLTTDLKDFILLDMGGQDTKIANIKNQILSDFSMNDKCAAGSGRYLENMANILDIKIEKMGDYHKNPIPLSNTCAIFGESETISYIVEGIDLKQIAAGVNYSIFKRVKNELKKFPENTIIFSGGMSNNKALTKLIQEKLRKKVLVNKNAQYNGALGCFYEAIKGSNKK